MLEGTIHAAERPEVGGVRATHPAPGRRDLLARLSAMSLAGLGRRLGAPRAAETEATAVARAWLELIDAGRPAVSWTAASPDLREAIDPDEWQAALNSARLPLGGCRARRLLDRAMVESVPGVPPGPYAVVHFESVFEDRPRAVETVTVRRAEDGRWRAVAYFIR